jgi:hypothetical protein
LTQKTLRRAFKAGGLLADTYTQTGGTLAVAMSGTVASDVVHITTAGTVSPTSSTCCPRDMARFGWSRAALFVLTPDWTAGASAGPCDLPLNQACCPIVRINMR